MVATRRQRQLEEEDDAIGTNGNGNAQNGTTADDADDNDGTEKSSQRKKEGLIGRLNARLDSFLFKPISIAPLVYFRIIFGAIMLWEVIRYFKGNKIRRYYIDPTFNFRYFGFTWMPGPLPGNYMFVFFLGMAILYTFLILGLWYRTTSILCFLGFFYWFYLDMVTYLNHFYLVLLISLVLIFIPAHRNASLDVLRHPELRVSTVPAWTRWVLTLVVSIPYFFGAIAKINGDWMRGEPMRIWLLGKLKFPLVGHLFKEWWACYFFSWGGFLYDLIIVPLLLWKRTRVIAIASTLFFHLMNDQMFTIGIFPWFMMFATPLFFEPTWVDPVLNFEWIFRQPIPTDRALEDSPKRRPIIKWTFCAFFTWQCLMPFRQHFYPGNTNWTEEGYLYSWHMMLRDKDGWADFTVTYPNTGKKVNVAQKEFLSKLQRKRMKERPEMVVQFGHFLCQHYGEEKGEPVQVHVDHMISLNGRKRQAMVDPDVDLCTAQWTMGPKKWILPLTIPLAVKDLDIILEMIDYSDGNDFIGRRIAKVFGENDIFFGTVTEYTPDRKRAWTVMFDDDDEEEFHKRDLAMALYLHQDHRDDDPKWSGTRNEAGEAGEDEL